MPTLHLIDADSTQACPTVLALIGQSIMTGDADDTLLVLGGNPLVKEAQTLGIENVHRLSVPFGNPRLARAIRPWAKGRKPFAKIHCWTIGALSLAADEWRDIPIELTLVHHPAHDQILRIRNAMKRASASTVKVRTLTDSIRERLIQAGIPAEVDSSFTQKPSAGLDLTRPTHDPRADWLAPNTTHRVVALLSDHPSQVNAMDAAAVICLAGASLKGGQGQPLSIKLLMHPDQWNRKRAQYFLTDQSDQHRIVQDVRAVQPRIILTGCDAALALGPNAAGMSLDQALNTGIPVIASDLPAAESGATQPANLQIAQSSAHKDVAHLLHQALSGTPAAYAAGPK